MTDRKPPPLVLTSPETKPERPRSGRAPGPGRRRATEDDVQVADDAAARPGARQGRGRRESDWTPPKPFDPVQARADTLAETERLRARRFQNFGITPPPFHDLSSCDVARARPPGPPRPGFVSPCPGCAALDAADAEYRAEIEHRGRLVCAGWSFMGGRITNPDGVVVPDYPRRPDSRTRRPDGPEDDRRPAACPGGRTGPAGIDVDPDDDPFA